MAKRLVFMTVASIFAILYLTGCGCSKDDGNSSMVSTGGNTSINSTINDNSMPNSSNISDPLNGVGDVVSKAGEDISSVL